jgi:hypothetical protein
LRPRFFEYVQKHFASAFNQQTVLKTLLADFHPDKKRFAPLLLGFHGLSSHCLKGFEMSSLTKVSGMNG